MPGVPLAGCVLRPGRAINCEALSGEGCKRGGEEGSLYCCRFTRHAYLTPAFLFPSLIPFLSRRFCFYGRRVCVSLEKAFSSFHPRSTLQPSPTCLSCFNFPATNLDANLRTQSRARPTPSTSLARTTRPTDLRF